MKQNFVVKAEARQDAGKGASRRLRHQGKVPAVLYGGNDAAQTLAINANDLKNHLKSEAFYNAILKLELDGKQQQVVLKDLQRHPARSEDILHLDLYRILADRLLKRHIPVHLIGYENSPGIKLEGGKLEHLHNDVEVECLPKDLPEYIEIDCSAMKLNDTIHLSQLVMPEGVKLVGLLRGHDDGVVAIHAPKQPAEEVVADAAAATTEVPAANQKAPAAAAAPAGKDGKAAPAGKDAKPAAAPAKKK